MQFPKLWSRRCFESFKPGVLGEKASQERTGTVASRLTYPALMVVLRLVAVGLSSTNFYLQPAIRGLMTHVPSGRPYWHSGLALRACSV